MTKISIGLIALVALLVVAGMYALLRLGREQPAAAGAPRSVGREHIDRALDRLYPGAREYRIELYAEPGEEHPPLAEIVAYRASEPTPHWHYITHGLSEQDAGGSGFGLEYTLRLVDDSDEPPVWPMNLLRFIAHTVRDAGQPFEAQQSINLPEGILDAVSPGVEGLTFAADPQVEAIETPNGPVTFVTVMPLMQRELWLVRAWDINRYRDVLRADQGDLLWRVGRVSLLETDQRVGLLEAVERDGSASRVWFAALTWTDGEVVLADETDRDLLTTFLRHRLGHGRTAEVRASGRSATFSPGEWHMACRPDTCAVSIPANEARALAEALAAAEDGATVARPEGVRFRLSFAP